MEDIFIFNKSIDKKNFTKQFKYVEVVSCYR